MFISLTSLNDERIIIHPSGVQLFQEVKSGKKNFVRIRFADFFIDVKESFDEVFQKFLTMG